MTSYQPVSVYSGAWRNDPFCDCRDEYLIRVGGSGGPLLGRDMGLTREDCLEIISWLEAAEERAREENVEA